MQTSNNEGKKVLLRVSNLKQYFPLKKKGLYVKANDGIMSPRKSFMDFSWTFVV